MYQQGSCGSCGRHRTSKIELNGEPYELLAFDTDKYTFTITDSERRYVQLDKWKGAQPSGEIIIPETVEWEGKHIYC